MDVEKGFWVFGYGSLMWNPEIAYSESLPARLEGLRRSFCMYSINYRGTAEVPGLVLALEEHEKSHCDGLAFRVEMKHADEAIRQLRERELITDAYQEASYMITLEDGRKVEAICYIIDKDHPQYAGDLLPETQAHIIARATGERGENADYLYATEAHLNELSISDQDISNLAREVKNLRELFGHFKKIRKT